MRRIATACLVSLVLAGPAAWAQPQPQPQPLEARTRGHLLEGVAAFQRGDYPRALVELRLVERAADAPADLAFYLGPTLYKLGRHEEALDVFLRAPQVTSDPLASFYLGQTYYQLRLYRHARALFAGLLARGLGPRLGAAAQAYVAAVDLLYAAGPPAPAVVDAYLDRGKALQRAGSPRVAAEVLDEARQVEALAAAPHRHGEIVEALAAARAALDTLGP